MHQIAGKQFLGHKTITQQIVVPNDFTPAAQEFFLSKDMTGKNSLKNLDAAWKNAVK